MELVFLFLEITEAGFHGRPRGRDSRGLLLPAEASQDTARGAGEGGAPALGAAGRMTLWAQHTLPQPARHLLGSADPKLVRLLLCGSVQAHEGFIIVRGGR